MQKPQTLLSAALVALALAFCPQAKADTTIISDTFTGAADSSLSLHTPDVDLANSTGTYLVDNHAQGTGAPNNGEIFLDGSGSSQSPFSAIAMVSIASHGSYVEPTTGELNLSIDFSLNTVQNDPVNGPPSGFTLGFLLGPPNEPGQGPGNTNIVGVVVAPNGSVYIEKTGNGSDLGRNFTLLGSAPAGYTEAGGGHTLL